MRWPDEEPRLRGTLTTATGSPQHRGSVFHNVLGQAG